MVLYARVTGNAPLRRPPGSTRRGQLLGSSRASHVVDDGWVIAPAAAWSCAALLLQARLGASSEAKAGGRGSEANGKAALRAQSRDAGCRAPWRGHGGAALYLAAATGRFRGDQHAACDHDHRWEVAAAPLLAFAATALSIGACCSEAVASCPDELPPLTVCSPVTGEPTPWGPLGPVGLVLVAAVLSSVFRDREEEADVGRRRFNAIAASAALLLAAAPRTPGGALAAALLAVGSFALGSVSAKLEGSGTQLAGVACGWAVLLGGVWWAAGLS
eukprot:CAMPEP_0117660714 /NCGR_PEP_ID=MMETSP0804-20121206/7112_1 /TAXON_ID=1074897 /ORGANISM="Tetraselmis astigmatica, Strain CCMP880" /LENGTH=273 /DNA_ID=CAMNT_0005467455 /DNA_START=75 /DNA_END=897 /DNA_ORIENTATION=+